MKHYKVAILGCGAILPRHIESIKMNSNFELVAVCDIQQEIALNVSKKHQVKSFNDFKEMVDSKVCNFVTIATPNSLHFDQAIYCLNNGCDVLIEKPVSFNTDEIEKIIECAKKNKREAYCVLQVRLNPTVSLLKKVLELGLLGNIRSVSMIQRWQRPLEYFTGWRAIPSVGGGTLYEVGIHYLDVLQFLFGLPKVHSSKLYQTKHKDVEIEDTIYSILDFGDFGGTCEVTIAAEPRNLECSISVIGSNGYIKIGGKALNVVESANFLSHGSQTEFDKLSKKFNILYEPNSYGSYQGSCPNHPYVYENLDSFKLEESFNVISLIQDIYKKSNVEYKIN
jgi:UDP-N-acetyl-2-amino-2-deoxyglucuronate dehydrogenase